MPIDLKAFALCKKKFATFKQNAGENPVSYDFKIEGQQRRTKQITTLMDELVGTMPCKIRSVLRADHSKSANPTLIIISSENNHPSETITKNQTKLSPSAPVGTMQNLSDEARMAAEHAKTPAQHASDLHDAISKTKQRRRRQKVTSLPEKSGGSPQSLLLTFPEFKEAICKASCDCALLSALCAGEGLMRLKYQKHIRDANEQFSLVVNTVQYLITVCTMMIKRTQNAYENQSVTEGSKDTTEAKKMHVSRTELIEYVVEVLPRDDTVIFYKSIQDASGIKRPHHHDVSQNGYFGKYRYPSEGPVQKTPYEPGEKLPVCYPSTNGLVRNSKCSFTELLIRDGSRATGLIPRDMKRAFPTVGQQTPSTSEHTHVKMFFSYTVAPILQYMQLLSRCLSYLHASALGIAKGMDLRGDIETLKETLYVKFQENEMVSVYLGEILGVIFKKLVPISEYVLSEDSVCLIQSPDDMAK